MQTIAPALEDALRARDGISPLRLEELSLRGNGVTAMALRYLVPIIESVRFDLLDIDLSQNCISVTTREEAEAFEIFLQSFSGCQVMRRLDLSGNDFSGPLAMEVLLRVYCRQPAVDLGSAHFANRTSGSYADYDMLTEVTNELGISPRVRRAEASEDTNANGSSTGSLAYPTFLQRQRGLRAIPYIILRGSKIDDAGALHLSYLVEQHHWPQQLMTKLKDGSKEAKRKDEDDASGLMGLITTDNPLLSAAGERLLEHAHAAREDLMGGSSPQYARTSLVGSSNGRVGSGRTRQMSFQSDDSGERRSSGEYNGDRRTSATVMNLPALRKRVQRTTIENHGIQGVQLWHAAAKVLFASRVILPPSTSRGNGLATAKHATEMQIVKAVPGEPVLAVTGLSEHPKLPAVVSGRTLTCSVPNGEHHTTNGTKRLQAPLLVSKSFDRDLSNPKGLPTSLWKRIFVEYADGEGILNEQQVENIVEYAGDRSNLKDEQQNHAKGKAHQVWHVLEQIDCLTYELV